MTRICHAIDVHYGISYSKTPQNFKKGVEKCNDDIKMICHRKSNKHGLQQNLSGNIKSDLNVWSEYTKSTTQFFGKKGNEIFFYYKIKWFDIEEKKTFILYEFDFKKVFMSKWK